MSRRQTLLLVSSLVSFALAACSSPTAPRQDPQITRSFCQVSTGSGTCSK
jgi:hypothetical protein